MKLKILKIPFIYLGRNKRQFQDYLPYFCIHIPLKKVVIFQNKKNTPNSVRLEYTHSRLYLSNYYSKTFGNPRQEARRLSKYFSYTTATILHIMCHTASNCTQNVQIITVYVNSLEMRIINQKRIE